MLEKLANWLWENDLDLRREVNNLVKEKMLPYLLYGEDGKP